MNNLFVFQCICEFYLRNYILKNFASNFDAYTQCLCTSNIRIDVRFAMKYAFYGSENSSAAKKFVVGRHTPYETVEQQKIVQSCYLIGLRIFRFSFNLQVD